MGISLMMIATMNQDSLLKVVLVVWEFNNYLMTPELNINALATSTKAIELVNDLDAPIVSPKPLGPDPDPKPNPDPNPGGIAASTSAT
ncbi:hypothetical protein RF55_21475 [Lasius niger]|uniref:Uncharacterized protein n=1 Tax=Lasius niger TaxID=67767 RepID=A0A0J7JYE2_LASNI|nr:hypothetical protein RF55_21475 [Lasius niger]